MSSKSDRVREGQLEWRMINVFLPSFHLDCEALKVGDNNVLECKGKDLSFHRSVSFEKIFSGKNQRVLVAM